MGRKRKEENQLRLLNCGDALELSKFKKEFKLKSLSLEGVKTEGNLLKETPPDVHSPKRKTSKESFPTRELLFENLITTEELAVIFRVSPQTIRNWVARRKIPYVQIGRRNLFQWRSLQQWLNQKEEPLWE